MNAYLVCGFAVVAAASIFTISSCKKDAASVTAGEVTASSTPVTHDKPYTLFSNTNRHVGIMVEDANGNLTPLDKTRKTGPQTLSTCANDSWAMDLVYRGYSIDAPCFGGPSELSHSWDLYLPEDVNITNDATCVARIKIGPFGFPAPTGTGFRTTPYQYTYIETVDVGGGTMMKKWRITANGTPITEDDYCFNQTLTPTFRLKTDCPDLTIIQPALTTDNFEINSLTIPDLLLYNGSDAARKIEFVPNLPICGTGCHGYWKWCTNYQVQYKSTTSSTWEPVTPFQAYFNYITSFKMPIIPSNPGTYQVRYKGLIKGDVNTGVWSEWIQPATTVVIP